MVSEKSSGRPKVYGSPSIANNSPKGTIAEEAVMKQSNPSVLYVKSFIVVCEAGEQSLAVGVSDTVKQQTQTSGQDSSTPEEQTYSYRSAPKSAKRISDNVHHQLSHTGILL